MRSGQSYGLKLCSTYHNLFQERTVIILLTVIIILFFICNFPQAILRIIHSVDGHHYKYNEAFQIFRITCNLLEFSNASSNFYIYVLCNRQVREHVNYLLKYCKKKLTITKSIICWRHKSYDTNHHHHQENVQRRRFPNEHKIRY